MKDYEKEDNLGLEFNRYTLTGEKDNIYKALTAQHEERSLGDGEYFSTYLRNHIERGIERLYEEYSHINSPIEFLMALAKTSR